MTHKPFDSLYCFKQFNLCFLFLGVQIFYLYLVFLQQQQGVGWASSGVGQKRGIPEKGRDEARPGGVKEYTALSKFRMDGTEGRKKKQKDKNMEAEAESNHKVFGRACLYPIGNEEFL